MKAEIKKYKPDSNLINSEYRVLASLIESPDELRSERGNNLYEILCDEFTESIGIYFYRFKNLVDPNRFSKIGENTRSISTRFQKGWFYKNDDTYLGKPFDCTDVARITPKNPMYFVFYELDNEYSHPKIDELYADIQHWNHFKRKTTNNEGPGNIRVGLKLVGHGSAFSQVLALQFPCGSQYPT